MATTPDVAGSLEHSQWRAPVEAGVPKKDLSPETRNAEAKIHVNRMLGFDRDLIRGMGRQPKPGDIDRAAGVRARAFEQDRQFNLHAVLNELQALVGFERDSNYKMYLEAVQRQLKPRSDFEVN